MTTRTSAAPRTRHSRTRQIAALRPRYQADLAHGPERFFEARRTDCPWCHSTRLREQLRTGDLMQHKPGVFTLDRCRDCGHIFQNPRLNEAGLEFYYRDWYDGLGERFSEFMFARAAKLYAARARALPPHVRPRRWLDVGTGHGHFCGAAQRVHPGAEFEGVDCSDGVEIAERHGRIARAHRGQFVELAQKLADRFDVVSMFHYLEHTGDPRAELRAAHAVLRPGGYLLIEVPDPQSYGRMLGKWWVPWLQPQHLHFVPIGNLCDALAHTGFTVVATDRREPHGQGSLSGALALMLHRWLPGENAPWLPATPDRRRRLARWLLLAAAAPALVAAGVAEAVLTPLIRRTRFANAYRVVARRD